LVSQYLKALPNFGFDEAIRWIFGPKLIRMPKDVRQAEESRLPPDDLFY